MKVAYFCMEFALKPSIPNYAGGLGVLATDLIRSCADLNKPVVGVTLMYHLSEEPDRAFLPGPEFKKREETIRLHIEDRHVTVGVWELTITGENGGVVPILFLDTNLPENKRWDRDITKNLYADDAYTRICQEVILGIGGVRMLRRLGYDQIETFHMNEGHAAFLTLELLKENGYNDDAVRKKCVFTTHTPIPAGHDQFEYPLAERVLGNKLPWHIKTLAGDKMLNMTRLALSLSKATNGVAKSHAAVCKRMFPDHEFLAITNGIHQNTWVADNMKQLFDRYLPGWAHNPKVFLDAEKIPGDALTKAHQENKKKLIDYINSDPEHFPFDNTDLQPDDQFEENVLTIAFARRFAPYKRALLLFRNLEKLRELGFHKIQLIFAGPYHQSNTYATDTIQKLSHFGKELRGQIRLVVLPDYNIDSAKRLVQGADIWLNTPEPPLEASGTSGMKAALNGTLNLSILDGWWIEGFKEQPRAGWAFGETSATQSSMNRDDVDAEQLYQQLKDVINCHSQHDHWVERMQSALRLGATFNTHRCIQEYEEKMWNL
ncbi:alpha-glucan family phosphorylase [Candidatus Peregrinibacteria bacterium]|nr:MAG: alpha-glucan family phosphorylase [Candidatus Peregrinibacteria bacterium]